MWLQRNGPQEPLVEDVLQKIEDELIQDNNENLHKANGTEEEHTFIPLAISCQETDKDDLEAGFHEA